MLLNNEFGIRVTGEPLSMMNLIGRLLTNAVSVKKSGPLMLVDCVEWIFCSIEWIVSGAHLSFSALLLFSSCIWFIFLLDRQLFAKWPFFPHFAHFFPLAGHSCCLDQFGAPYLLQSIFLNLLVYHLSPCWFVSFFHSGSGCSSFLMSLVSHLISRTCIRVVCQLLFLPTCHFF